MAERRPDDTWVLTATPGPADDPWDDSVPAMEPGSIVPAMEPPPRTQEIPTPIVFAEGNASTIGADGKPMAVFWANQPTAPPEPAPVDPATRCLDDLQRNGYRDLTPELTKDILYLEQLASSTATWIGDWRVIELLTPITRGDKRAINKLFFAKLEDQKAALGSMDKTTFERIQRSMFDVAEKNRKRALEDAKYQYSSALETVRSRQRQLLEYIKIARSRYDIVVRLENQSPKTAMDEFELLLKNPFFTFERFAYNTAYFRTTNPVVMSQKNASLGINASVNLGKFRFALDISSSTLYCSKLENNLIVVGRAKYWHPFISNDGDICFGTSADVVAKMLIERQWSKVFEILASLLVTYDNGANPYIGFDHFIAADKAGQKRFTYAVCGRGCGMPAEDCKCPYCTYCSEYGHFNDECPKYCSKCSASPKEQCKCAEMEEEEDESDEEETCSECEHTEAQCDESDCECPSCH
jgi:hypothetical protein